MYRIANKAFKWQQINKLDMKTVNFVKSLLMELNIF